MSKNFIKSFMNGDGYYKIYRHPRTLSYAKANQKMINMFEEADFNIPSRVRKNSNLFNYLPSSYNDIPYSNNPYNTLFKGFVWAKSFNDSGLPEKLISKWEEIRKNSNYEYDSYYNFDSYDYLEYEVRKINKRKFKKHNEIRKLRKRKNMERWCN